MDSQTKIIQLPVGMTVEDEVELDNQDILQTYVGSCVSPIRTRKPQHALVEFKSWETETDAEWQLGRLTARLQSSEVASILLYRLITKAHGLKFISWHISFLT